jgi:hydroxyethylthiazole kinase-like uncharacterized protein yjeF
MAVKPDPGGFPQRKLSEIKAVNIQQMRDIQRVAQEDYGYDILQIAENAGRACSLLALQMLGGRGKGQVVVILAGGGNKGAAGLVAARNLSNWGMTVEPILADVESEMSFATRRELGILRESGVVEPSDMETSEITLEDHLVRADLVIDALIGYGLEGPPVGIAAAATELAVASHKPILALDVPTGVNASSGLISSPAIRACTTLMLDLPKRGVLEAGARSHAGELYLADLGIPISVHERLGISIANVFTEGPIVRLRR